MQSEETTRKLSSILIQLAKRQDELAANEAAAATLLRAEADRLATAGRRS